jgi:8-oxo-dGTP pyrophosphatase MutT (NUDIX family)
MIKKISTFILYNKETKRFLLQYKSDYKGKDSSRVSLFGGGLNKGESFLQAVRREAYEELRYKLTKPKLFSVEKNLDGDTTYFQKIYVAVYDTKQKLIKDFETKKILWMTYSQILKVKNISERRKNFFIKNKTKLLKLIK